MQTLFSGSSYSSRRYTSEWLTIGQNHNYCLISSSLQRARHIEETLNLGMKDV